MQCLGDDSGILAVIHSHEWLLPVKSDEVVGGVLGLMGRESEHGEVVCNLYLSCGAIYNIRNHGGI